MAQIATDFNTRAPTADPSDGDSDQSDDDSGQSDDDSGDSDQGDDDDSGDSDPSDDDDDSTRFVPGTFIVHRSGELRGRTKEEFVDQLLELGFSRDKAHRLLECAHINSWAKPRVAYGRFDASTTFRGVAQIATAFNTRAPTPDPSDGDSDQGDDDDSGDSDPSDDDDDSTRFVPGTFIVHRSGELRGRTKEEFVDQLLELGFSRDKAHRLLECAHINSWAKPRVAYGRFDASTTFRGVAQIATAFNTRAPTPDPSDVDSDQSDDSDQGDDDDPAPAPAPRHPIPGDRQGLVDAVNCGDFDIIRAIVRVSKEYDIPIEDQTVRGLVVALSWPCRGLVGLICIVLLALCCCRHFGKNMTPQNFATNTGI